MAINKVVYNNNVLLDLSPDTLVSADQLLQGVTAHGADGSSIVGGLVPIIGGMDSVTGTFAVASTTVTSYTVTHNLGVVPKIIAVYEESSPASNSTKQLYLCVAISPEVDAGAGGYGWNFNAYVQSSGSSVFFRPNQSMSSTYDYTLTKASSTSIRYASIWKANETSFTVQVNTSYYTFHPYADPPYRWIAAG